jgi:DNA end-binding protein Ku
MKVLEKKGVVGVASIAIRNKESLCALRPLDDTLLLETLRYPDEIREREDELPQVMVNERELSIAASLVDALAEPFDPSKYHDHYREALVELIKNKTKGKAVVAPETAAPAQVTDIMEALRASLEAARNRKSGAAGEPAGSTKPAKAAPKGRKPARRKTAA